MIHQTRLNEGVVALLNDFKILSIWKGSNHLVIDYESSGTTIVEVKANVFKAGETVPEGWVYWKSFDEYHLYGES